MNIEETVGRSRLRRSTIDVPQASQSLADDVDEHFREVAALWLVGYVDRPSFRMRLRVLAEVIRDACAGDCHRVLDFGGGPGVFSLVASGRASAVVCLDRSFPMIAASAPSTEVLDRLSEIAGTTFEPDRIQRVAGGLSCLRPGADRGFDLILAIAVLEYLNDPSGALTELLELSAPSGRIVLTVPNRRSPVRIIERLSDGLAVTLAKLVRHDQLARRRYASVRPHGSNVQWGKALEGTDVVVESTSLVPLGERGLRSWLRPNRVIVLQRNG